MASVIAFGVLISQLLLQLSFLGSLREALPLATFQRMAGDTISGLHFALPVAIAVAVAWALAALVAGGCGHDGGSLMPRRTLWPWTGSVSAQSFYAGSMRSRPGCLTGCSRSWCSYRRWR